MALDSVTRTAGALLRLLALVVLAMFLASCAGASAAAVSATPVVTTTVTMAKSYRFEPIAIQVRAGSTVTWHNDDNFTHSVFVHDGSGRNPVAAPGQSVSLTFETPGEFTYTCSFHPQNMKGRVIVTG
jgi:plastocyanin